MEIELEIKVAGNELELKLKGWRLFTTLVALALLAIGAPQCARSLLEGNERGTRSGGRLTAMAGKYPR